MGAPHPPHGRARAVRAWPAGVPLNRLWWHPRLVISCTFWGKVLAPRPAERRWTAVGCGRTTRCAAADVDRREGCRGWVSRGLTQTRAPDPRLVPGEQTVGGNAGGVGGGRRLSVDKAVDTVRAAAVDPAVWQASSRSARGSADQQVTRGSSLPAWRNPSSAWHAGGYRRCHRADQPRRVFHRPLHVRGPRFGIAGARPKNAFSHPAPRP